MHGGGTTWSRWAGRQAGRQASRKASRQARKEKSSEAGSHAGGRAGRQGVQDGVLSMGTGGGFDGCTCGGVQCIKCFEVFSCTHFPDGKSYLDASPSVQCWATEHISMVREAAIEDSFANPSSLAINHHPFPLSPGRCLRHIHAGLDLVPRLELVVRQQASPRRDAT
eukprot:3883946-Rhodomonas_salina.2